MAAGHEAASGVALDGIENVFAAVCDLNGTLRGKRVLVDQVRKVLDGALRMPLSITGLDIWGEDIVSSELVFETGDADGICEYTGRGILPINYTTKPTALIPLWLREENGTPFAGDPRRALAEVSNRFKAHGLTPVVATELEFYLVDPSESAPQPPKSPVTGKRLDSDGALSVDELEHFDELLNDIYEACRQQGIPADSAISENGIGQFEINMMHVADPLRAADDAVYFKRVVRGLARKHGFAATFMAKPYGDRAGSGFHVHCSLIDGSGRNVFDNGGADGTPMLRHAIGGMLATLPQLALTFAPHENSFRRLVPGAHAPSSVAWGYENRTVALRVPGGSTKARRFEHRVAGADANPYLVLSSILGGALLGIEREIEPPPPITGDAYSQNLPGLPPDWASAIAAYAEGGLINDIYSKRLQRMVVNCKEQEMKFFRKQVSNFEYHTYLETV